MKFVWRQLGETPQVSVTSTTSTPAVTEPAATAVPDPATSAPPPPPPVGDPNTVQTPAGTIIPDPATNQTNCAPNCSSSAALETGSRSEEASQSQSVVISKTASPSPSSNGTIASGNPSPDTQRATAGLSGGTVAGVAIGMFLVGLLIAGVVFFFLLRRQKQKRYNPASTHLPSHAHNHGAAGHVEKGPTVATSAYASNIDDVLPQPASDDTITDAALKIRDNIKNHVREFYHVSPVPATSIIQANIKELAIATGTSSSVLASMLSNISTRVETLRLIVAWSVLSRCTGERAESLLPGELAPLASAVPGKDGKNAAQSAMYSKWKTMTGALLHGRIGQDTQERFQRFASAAADLDAVVAPFVQSGLEAQRRKNLDMILARSANFAFLLFEQPGVFRFGFSSEHGGLAVFPALIQIIGDQGQVLVPSRVLLEKEIAA